jgi:hypothetical protein
MDLFPVEINRCSYEMLLRIPGIGLISTRRIYHARKLSPITFEGLKKMGIVLKRAKHFILVGGKYYGNYSLNKEFIYESISEKKDQIQLSLFNEIDKKLGLSGPQKMNPELLLRNTALQVEKGLIQKSLGGDF